MSAHHMDIANLQQRVATLENEAPGGGVPTSRTITAGTGLQGGGDLSANRTLAVSTKLAALDGLTWAANKMLALTGAATASVVDATEAGLAMLAAATVTAQTALLNALVGDSGVGGTKGMVPAPAAGDAALGKVLLATGLWGWAPEWIPVAVGDETTALTTGTAKVRFRAPYACNLLAVRASLSAASSSGNPTFDINEGDSPVSLLSTKLSIDAGAKTSVGATTPAVISDAAIANDAEVSIDIDIAGTNAAGAKVYLYIQRTA